MGFIDWFTFKSKEEREADERRYRRYIFPYGDKQKEAVAALIAELMPKEPASTAMAVFLMGKEGYMGSIRMHPEDREARTEAQKVSGAVQVLKRQLVGKNSVHIPAYLALILADVSVGEDLNYPTADELRARAAELSRDLQLRREG